MRKPAKCPTCNTPVPVPRGAEQGDEVTCPECDEEFVPPSLQKGNYSAYDEEGYGVGGLTADPEKAQKKRKAKALMAHGRSEHANRYKSPKAPAFGGPLDMVMLVLAAVCAVALPLGYVIAKRSPTSGEGALIALAVSGVLGVYGFRIIRARWRIGG